MCLRPLLSILGLEPEDVINMIFTILCTLQAVQLVLQELDKLIIYFSVVVEQIFKETRIFSFLEQSHHLRVVFVCTTCLFICF